MQQNHQIGILLDGPALAQVTQLRTPRPVFRLTVELTRHDDRTPQRARQPLQLAAALRHLLFTRTPRIHRGKQLQIVDDKQAQQPLCPQRLGDDTQLARR